VPGIGIIKKRPLVGCCRGFPRAGRSLRDTRSAQKWRTTAPVIRWLAGTLPLLALVASCATPICHPLTIVVAGKEERARLETVPRGVRTTETGRLEEDRRPEVVRDYWVRAADGTWYPITLDRYRGVEVGQPLEICR
jgi:hypothetical protein